MNLGLAEAIVRWLGGLLAYIMLGVNFYGIWRGTQRQVGRTTGHAGSWLRSPWLYLSSSALFFGICYFAWFPLPWEVSPQTRAWMLAFGSLLYFPGMSLVVWGRLTLGEYYFVSTGFGAQLFAGHRLITNGPYAIVRHPTYAGLILASFGSLFIYSTSTTLFFACFAPLITTRAFREEKVLAAEFGEQWQDYCRRFPMFFPRLKQ